MEEEYSKKILPSERDKRSGCIYRLARRIESKIDQEYDAEQAKIPIKIESESEDELENIIAAASQEPLLTTLKMSCSDDEDPFGSGNDESGSASQTNYTTNYPAAVSGMPTIEFQSNGTSNNLTAATIMNMFSTISQQITLIRKDTENIKKEITSMSHRLGRVENKVGISLATLEQVKDSVLMPEPMESEDMNEPAQQVQLRFVLKKITTEEELKEVEEKLGTDEEYLSNVKKYLKPKINNPDPHNRMRIMLDLIFDRKFFAECSWTGASLKKTKIALRTRANILKLFMDLGSTKLVKLNEDMLEQFFLSQLKNSTKRANVQGLRKLMLHRKPIKTYLSQ